MHGCPQCVEDRVSRQSPDYLFGDLYSAGNIHQFFERSTANAEEYPGGIVTYPSVTIRRCQHCRAMWIQDYEEIVTEDRMLEEWGHRCRRIALLDQIGLQEIEQAMASGGKLPIDRYFAPRAAPPAEAGAPVGASGRDGPAEEPDTWESIIMFCVFGGLILCSKFFISWLFQRYVY